MRPKAGLWIDHRNAIIELITENMDEVKEEFIRVASNLEQHEFAISEKQYGRRDRPAYDIRKRNSAAYTDAYYDRVIAALRNAEEVYIFGPGSAKYELKKRIERNGIYDRLIRTEPAAKLTGHQIVAKVRNYYNIGQQVPAHLYRTETAGDLVTVR